MGFGGFGGGNMQNLMRQAQKMQEEIQKQRQEIEESTVLATSGGGMVEVTMTGKRQIVSLKIAPQAIDPEDKEMLEDLIVAAINDANSQIDAKFAESMPNLPGGMF